METIPLSKEAKLLKAKMEKSRQKRLEGKHEQVLIVDCLEADISKIIDCINNQLDIHCEYRGYIYDFIDKCR